MNINRLLDRASGSITEQIDAELKEELKEARKRASAKKREIKKAQTRLKNERKKLYNSCKTIDELLANGFELSAIQQFDNGNNPRKPFLYSYYPMSRDEAIIKGSFIGEGGVVRNIDKNGTIL